MPFSLLSINESSHENKKNALAWFQTVHQHYSEIDELTQLIIKKADFIEHLKALYSTWIELGMNQQFLDRQWHNILENAHKIELNDVFKILGRHNFPFKQYNLLFPKVLNSNQTPNVLENIYQLFTEYQIPYPVHELDYITVDFHSAILDFHSSLEDVRTVFEILKKYGIKITSSRATSILNNANSLLNIHEVFDFFISENEDFTNDQLLIDSLLALYTGSSHYIIESIHCLRNSGLDKLRGRKILSQVLITRDHSHLQPIIKLLLKWNITNEGVIHILFSNKLHLDRVSTCMDIMHSKGMNFANEYEFFDVVFPVIIKTIENKTSFNHSLSILLDTLDLLKIHYKDDLFELLHYIETIPYAPDWDHAFFLMREIGYSFDKNPEFYDFLIKTKEHITSLTLSLHALYINGAKDSPIFKVLLKRYADIKFVNEILDLLKENHITYAEHPELFTKELLLTHDEMVLHFLNELKQAGYNSDTYPEVYLFFIEKLSTTSIDYLHLIEVLKQLCDHEKNNKLVQSEQQKNAIKAILSPNNDFRNQFTYSPLNLSPGTEIIQAICTVIVELGLDNVDIYYQEGSYFFQDKARNQTLNLSLIIKNANLSQLCLDEKLIDDLGALLKPICFGWQPEHSGQIKVLDCIQPAERAALDIYFDYGYMNINRLFRDEEQFTGPEPEDEDEPQYNVVYEEETHHQITVFFLLGCLSHNAINRVPYLQEIEAGKNVGMLNQGKMLIRTEKLSQDTIDQRKANPGLYPALTSFSLFKEGVTITNTDANTYTKLDNGLGFPMVYAEEAEVIFPQGTQVITRQIRPDFLVATLLCSPSLEKSFSYWADMALLVTWQQHLKHPYKDEPEEYIVHEEVLVHRQNHGLVHAFDVRAVVVPAIQHFAKHAVEDEFREFCQNVSTIGYRCKKEEVSEEIYPSLLDDVVELLHIAAAYNVSGREGEPSYFDDPERYLQYRQASAENFVHFILCTPYAKNNPTLIVDMHDVIRARSNPNYESELDTLVASRQINPDSAKTRKFLHRILSFAHDVNLVRCSASDEYEQSMSYYESFVEQTDMQKANLAELIRYVIELHKAHGDALLCDMTPEGDLMDVDETYTPTFFKVSHSIKDLTQISESVTRPSVTLPFQWKKDDTELKRKSEGKTPHSKRQMISSPDDEMEPGYVFKNNP